MATIEENAYKQYPVHNDFIVEECRRLGRAGYIKGATEQDRIARAEERERCIKVAQDYFCNRTCAGFDIEHVLCQICDSRKNLRKAMEGDNNGND